MIVVRGVVRDAGGQPLVGAEARLDQRRVAYSDSTGGFTLRGVPAQRATLTVRRIGYEPASIALAPSGAQLRLDVKVQLQAAPYRLSELLVEGKAYDRGLWNVGFYKRQQKGYGKYFDPDYMQHFGGANLGSLAREVPRVEVRKYGSHYFAFGRLGGNACRMHVFVDGAYRREAVSGNPLSRSDHGIGLDELLSKEDVYAVEVYPSINSLPFEFTIVGPKPGSISSRPAPHIPTRPGSQPPPSPDDEGTTNDQACGAIVIWTKWHVAAEGKDSTRRAP